MRGIILAGGTGSRLGPLTKTINKHLLPVGGVPMIFHPLRVLRDNAITDITIVSTPRGVGQIAELLGSGAEHGCTFTYRVQDQPGGIAQALKCADDGTEEDVVAVLGDNVFATSPVVRKTESSDVAICFLNGPMLKCDLKEFGVPVFKGKKIRNLVEKPADPPSQYAVTGLYVFPASIRMKIFSLKAGVRGEYEITDVLRMYAIPGCLSHKIIDGFWGDAGTLAGMAECNEALKGTV